MSLWLIMVIDIRFMATISCTAFLCDDTENCSVCAFVLEWDA